ncbi:MAG TPA: 1,4-alpha-glucan branching protein GlgB [Burkholderiales bacterium]|nr:1,4-alpha-glucan branching protein GlgB [Burkholderiales bacterium]
MPSRPRARARLTDHDIYLFREGSHTRLYEKLGCHLGAEPGQDGAQFSVWAPNARAVSVVGDFNGWEASALALTGRADGSGIWEGHSSAVRQGDAYKYLVTGRDGRGTYKGDPFAFYWEAPPRSASRAWRLDYAWNDAEWMRARGGRMALDAPFSIYEVHLGSWRRGAQGEWLDYREIAAQLAAHVKHMGYTHVELMPVTEHPFYGSWGYQTTGYYAPTARYGTPQDFMHLVDTLHQHGIGVILDWVPSHFPNDDHGLYRFDGTHLYEHADPQQGYHPEWKSHIFNYGRHEVRSFLLSSALFWLDQYHIDGLRVDAVASMLYLDYARKSGEWVTNIHGGRENLAAIQFLQMLNAAAYRDHPDVQIIAEESTAWPMVSRPTHVGGLGFGMKWNMGWMHDTLRYFSEDPVHRRYHQDQLTFSIWYAFTENFMLPLSHDEVVHGKGSLIGRMPGDTWQQFANLRLLYGYMWGHPGKKLVFMGGEFGQRREWQHEESLEWHVLQYPEHAGLMQWVADLNRFYAGEPALHQTDFEAAGFEWIDCSDTQASVMSFLRKSRDGSRNVIIVCNFTPVPRENYTIGAPRPGYWAEALNSDATVYGGSGSGNLGGVSTRPVPAHGREHSLTLTLPPLAALILRHEG